LGKKKNKQKQPLKASPVEEEVQSQEKPEKKKKFKKPTVPKKLDKPNWLLTGLAATGMALTAYLAITYWLGEPPLYCTEGSSCEIVQQSRWGTFLFLPTAFWGFLTYATLGHIGFRFRDRASHWKWAFMVSLIGLGYSIYLVSISLFVIKAACAYCLASFAIMTVILGVVIFQRPKDLPDLNIAAWAKQAAIVAVVIVAGMHLNYSGIFDSGAGAEDPYLQGLAEHLVKEDAMMYGAFW
jgi:uncharacterized membrane protein